ncbi:MAG: hypothetical protein QOE05_2091 [Actinomycetota bacterium]|jgi:peptidoglycan/LPS O-acetylase OafA/YrhL|nr:hypothetical protein [Actinomycetota bacterium]
MPKGLRYAPSLDGVRGIALLVVILHHTHLFPSWGGGAVSVDVFFVLSGYLITRILLAEREESGGVSFRHFYARRALRLWPALLTMLIVVGALLYAGVLEANPGGRGPAVSVGIAAFYLSNIAVVFWPHLVDPFGQTWSLAVEEQFYLAWPPMLLLLFRWTSRPVRWVLAGAAISAVGLVLGNTLLYHPVESYVLPVTHAVGLLCGCALAMASRWGTDRWQRYIVPAVITLTVLAVLLPNRNGSLRAFGIIAASLASVPLVAFLVEQPGSRMARFLGSAVPRTLGRWSYTVYLWHYPLIVGLRHAHPDASRTASVIGALVSFPIAALSFYFIEMPFQRMKAKLRPKAEAAIPDEV